MKTKILVIDDYVDAADTLVALLQHYDFDVAVANSGIDALRIAAVFLPQVVLLDLCLPDQHGLETARRLRLLDGGTTLRIIALTSFCDEATRLSVIEAGLERRLVKPASLEQLLDAIDNPP